MKTHGYRAQATIAAIATPPGEGGVSIVRISGPEALMVAGRLFSGPVHAYKSHTAHVGKVIDAQGRLVDEALLLVMRAPHSYTGEETVEIHCHGGSFVARKILETALQAGALAAQPGEFTFKAYMNGKLDLAQAEAVQELIGAKNDLALSAAEQQLQGALSNKIASFQKRLIDIAAILEAWVDFPEEDLAFAPMEEVIGQLEAIERDMQRLADTFHEGKVIRYGLSVCLAGLPNAGKSSLMNALVGKERAIVTDIAGTTRDLIEEEIRLGALTLHLIDTAGIRETEEIIEREGVRRSRSAIAAADLVLCVLDASVPVCAQTQALLDELPKHKTIVAWNKVDLSAPTLLGFSYEVRLSAKTSEGLEDLKQCIEQLVWRKGSPCKEEVILTNARHAEAIQKAITALACVIHGLRTGVSAEFVSSDMRQTLIALGAIIGSDITEEILNVIFSKFCIGK
jgi:tRNA modification GTPase